jgi:hypothetical protein
LKQKGLWDFPRARARARPGEEATMKKPYQKPSIVFTEKLEIRAIACLLNGNRESCQGALLQ